MESDINQDWPNLQRYEDENQNLGPPKKMKIELFFWETQLPKDGQVFIQVTLKKSHI